MVLQQAEREQPIKDMLAARVARPPVTVIVLLAAAEVVLVKWVITGFQAQAVRGVMALLHQLREVL
jgi:hypothetical protein